MKRGVCVSVSVLITNLRIGTEELILCIIRLEDTIELGLVVDITDERPIISGSGLGGRVGGREWEEVGGSGREWEGVGGRSQKERNMKQ